jgi:Fe2+ transport system protein FeoA
MILDDLKAGRVVSIAGASSQVKERLNSLGILEKLAVLFQLGKEALRKLMII